ncbi:hypothetical protein [Streptomyces sp. AC154]|uniref:hypothetical protein n=1 Tax=Streptomyces sp. AC154 TaxID=3143184 RepID=UPI003F7DFEAB
MLDLVLLLQAMDEEAVRQFGADLDRVGLWPEWRQAMRGVARLGWRPTVALPYTRAAAVRVRLARSVRTAVRWSNPVRAAAFAAQSGIEGRGGRPAALASDLVHRRPGARRLLASGVPLFGVPLGGGDTGSNPPAGARPDDPAGARPPAADPVDGLRLDGLRLDDVGRHLVARTPLGSFLLVSGAARQEWLDEVDGAESAPRTASAPTGPSSTGTSSSGRSVA